MYIYAVCNITNSRHRITHASVPSYKVIYHQIMVCINLAYNKSECNTGDRAIHGTEKNKNTIQRYFVDMMYLCQHN